MARPTSEPSFAAPWEARALAISIALREVGLIPEADWSAALGAAIRAAQASGDPDTGETYYRHVLAALEHIVAEKELAAPADLAERRAILSSAAANGHHGQKDAADPPDEDKR